MKTIFSGHGRVLKYCLGGPFSLQPIFFIFMQFSAKVHRSRISEAGWGIGGGAVGWRGVGTKKLGSASF